MPAMYGERENPGYIKTEDEAIEYARAVDRDYSSLVWLVLFKINNIYINPNVNIKSRNEVTMKMHVFKRIKRI